jgi:hypothetical protein
MPASHPRGHSEQRDHHSRESYERVSEERIAADIERKRRKFEGIVWNKLDVEEKLKETTRKGFFRYSVKVPTMAIAAFVLALSIFILLVDIPSIIQWIIVAGLIFLTLLAIDNFMFNSSETYGSFSR